MLFFKGNLPQNYFWKVGQSCSPKLFPETAPQNYSPKMFSKAIAPKLRFYKPVYQNRSPKLFCKMAPESCSPRLLLRATSRNGKSYFPKWFIKLTPKIIPKNYYCSLKQQNYFGTFAKITPQSASPKPIQNCSKLPCKVAPQRNSYSPKLLFPISAPQSCSPKPFPQIIF